MRFKMRLAIDRESLFVKYRRNRSGATFARQFLVGRRPDFLFKRDPPKD